MYEILESLVGKRRVDVLVGNMPDPITIMIRKIEHGLVHATIMKFSGMRTKPEFWFRVDDIIAVSVGGVDWKNRK